MIVPKPIIAIIACLTMASYTSACKLVSIIFINVISLISSDTYSSSSAQTGNVFFLHLNLKSLFEQTLELLRTPQLV